MAGTPYLVDSNILLRWVKPDHNDYLLVVSAIEAILGRDGELCYKSQNVGEFWNTCTRPLDRNGSPLTTSPISKNNLSIDNGHGQPPGEASHGHSKTSGYSKALRCND